MARLGTGQTYADRQVYRGPNTPTDTRDGVIWVDTSANPPRTRVYDSSVDAWENLAHPIPPIYGDGSEGTVTYSASATLNAEDSYVTAETITVESGVTLGSSDGFYVGIATERITIDGTFDLRGDGASGGTGSGGGGAGSPGNAGHFRPAGTGGSGGAGGASYLNGGDGGDGDVAVPRNTDKMRSAPLSMANLAPFGAGGGGGGGGDNNKASRVSGSNGNAPGGGGGGVADADSGQQGVGGDGGDGGGGIILFAPNIDVNGTIDVRGTNGQGGGDGGGHAAGGGGGGGSGGLIALFTPNLNENGPTYRTAGGSGGSGGTSYNSSGGRGADGADGIVIKGIPL